MARPSPALVRRVSRLLGEQRSVPSIARETGRSLGIRDRYLDPDALPLVQAVELVPEIGSTTEERTAGVHRGGTAPTLRVVSQE